MKGINIFFKAQAQQILLVSAMDVKHGTSRAVIIACFADNGGMSMFLEMILYLCRESVHLEVDIQTGICLMAMFCLRF